MESKLKMKYKQVFFLWLLAIMLFKVCAYGQQTGRDSRKNAVDSFVIKLQERNHAATGKPFPPFTAFYQNKIFTNKNLAGKVVFITFWFAACAPCIAEMDALNTLYDSLKNNPRFEFISFTYEKQAIINKVAKEHKIRYKILSVKQQDCYKLNQYNSFPTNIIVDANGIIQLLETSGYDPNDTRGKAVMEEFYPKLVSMLK